MKLIIFIELLSVFLCMFRVYGKKPKPEIKGIITFGVMFIILDAVNYWGISRNFIFLAYVVLAIYCMLNFKEKPIKAVVGVVLAVSIMAVIQFCSMILLSVFSFEYYIIRDLLGISVTFLFTWLLLPFCKVDKLRDAICRKHWLMYIIFVFITFIISFAIISGKMSNELQMGMFLFGIPAIGIIVFLVIYWDISMAKEKTMKDEIEVMNSMQHRYDELLEQVRINQHGFQNHITAVFSSHYTCKTYEQLVETQQAYCNELCEENKYNNILLIQNNILAGFLYDKILEIERKQIKYSYKIETKVDECRIPYFYLIEVLGILIDNAMEAVLENQNEGMIYLATLKDESGYKFIVGNTYRQVNYDEIEKWFMIGKTTKGKGHGLGLYRVKQLCKEWNCEINCLNQMMEGQNWIMFELFVEEKEDVV